MSLRSMNPLDYLIASLNRFNRLLSEAQQEVSSHVSDELDIFDWAWDIFKKNEAASVYSGVCGHSYDIRTAPF